MLHKAASTLLSSPCTAPPAPTHTVDLTAVLVFATVFANVFPSACVLKLSLVLVLPSQRVIAFVFTIIYNRFLYIIVLVFGSYGNVHPDKEDFQIFSSVPHLFRASYCSA